MDSLTENEQADSTASKWVSPLRSIRLKCLDCCGGQIVEVRECQIESCALWPFRMGHNPNRKGLGGKFKHAVVVALFTLLAGNVWAGDWTDMIGSFDENTHVPTYECATSSLTGKTKCRFLGDFVQPPVLACAKRMQEAMKAMDTLFKIELGTLATRSMQENIGKPTMQRWESVMNECVTGK